MSHGVHLQFYKRRSENCNDVLTPKVLVVLYVVKNIGFSDLFRDILEKVWPFTQVFSIIGLLKKIFFVYRTSDVTKELLHTIASAPGLNTADYNNENHLLLFITF